ncbi:N-acetyltransferase [Labedella populi]|uniref:N-acetyltransferase n=1 Tax=Labedella populi TaxID=2498850 RepID=A0A3S4E7M5_9MICO|nr:GNAT family N-acetyltransferase [Labedella populi]RWZ68176.1 N-acetyltransferase [Labedella populi]
MTGLGDQLANHQSYWHGWGVDDRSTGALSLYKSGVPAARLNAVTHNSEISDVIVDDVRARMAGVPFLWEVSELSHPDTARLLEAHGGTYVGGTTIMEMDLRDVGSDDPPAELTVVEISAPDSLHEWVRGYSASMGLGAHLGAPLVGVERGRVYPAHRFRRFAGLVDGGIVATAEILSSGDLVGVYLVSTAEAFRGRGFASALTMHALREARAAGATWATLQTSGMGRPVYESLGFDAVSTLHAHLFSAPPHPGRARAG